ncbi:MAG: hypothetical protein ACOCVP_04145 [Wenzhouxiangella sp.]
MNYAYPGPYPMPPARPQRGYYEMARIGAVAGFCGTGARNLYRLQNGDITRAEAALDTLRGSATAGLAAGAASLVASQFRSPVASFLAGIATGTAVVYGLERAMVRGDAE